MLKVHIATVSPAIADCGRNPSPDYLIVATPNTADWQTADPITAFAREAIVGNACAYCVRKRERDPSQRKRLAWGDAKVLAREITHYKARYGWGWVKAGCGIALSPSVERSTHNGDLVTCAGCRDYLGLADIPNMVWGY